MDGFGVLEDEAAPGESVDLRTGGPGIAVGAEVVGAKGVDGDQQDIALVHVPGPAEDGDAPADRPRSNPACGAGTLESEA